MAERRMFTKTIIESDLFLDMPISARLLYYDMGMRGDDDGFVNSPKRVMRVTGVHDDDLKVLIAKGFVIPFESGVLVIRHWKTHNYIRSDRYKPTQYKYEKSLLCEDSNGHYMLVCENQSDRHPVTTGLPVGVIGEAKLDEVSKSNNELYCEQATSSNTRSEVARSRQPPAARKVDFLPVHSMANADINAMGFTVKTKPEQGADTAAITLLLNDGTEHPVYQSQVAAWAQLYPAVDIEQELRNIKGWVDANPRKRKTRRGINAFLNSWLTRTQNKNSSSIKPQGGNRANYQIGGEDDPYKNIMSD